MSRRDQIRMTDDEVEAFLATPRTLNIATIGADGRPHLVAMWFGFLRGDVAFWTYGKSQKIVNIRRDPRVTCLAEDGTTYDTLRGVEILGTAHLVEDPEDTLAVAESVFSRYTGPVDANVREALRTLAQKRVAVRIETERIVSWDHRKLQGAY